MVKQKLIEYIAEHSDFKKILKLHLHSDGFLMIKERWYDKELNLFSFDAIEIPKSIWSKLFSSEDLFEMWSNSIKVWDIEDFEFGDDKLGQER